jgi:hypothetical protein
MSLTPDVSNVSGDHCVLGTKYHTLFHVMEQHALKNVNIWWSTNISFYLDTSGGKNSSLYLNVVHFFNTSLN